MNSLPPDKFVRWKTWTTRTEIRNDEVAVDPYVRVTKEIFEEEEKRGNFVETNPYVGNRYGTHRGDMETAFADGRIPVLRVDPRGALVFNKLYQECLYPFSEANLHHVYVIPPGLRQLRLRLQKRDRDPVLVEKRYQAALEDLQFSVNAHYLLINHEDKMKGAITALTSHLASLYSSF